MTNWSARILDLALAFLGSGSYRAEIYADAEDADQAPKRVSIPKSRFGLRWSSETRHIETIAEWPSLGRGREPKDMLLCAKCTCLRGLESYAKTLYNLPSSPARGNCCLAISRRNPSHGETVSSVTAGFRSAQRTFARHYR
jgi:hypothetical protein